jgi:NhaP-type Na+/H+ or K+/H+ antiporter
MLLVGIITANLSYIHVEPISLNSQISNIIRYILFKNQKKLDLPLKHNFYRKLALCVILCRAGLGVNIEILKRIKFQVFKLACLPVINESISFSVVNKFILNMPWSWSFLLG